MVRSALISDVPWIVQLDKECFSMPRNKIDYRDFFVDSNLRGYIDIKTVIDEGYIGNIAVKPEYRRQGIADELISAVINKAKSEKLAFVTLEVRASNSAAIGLYLKHGFKEEGRIKNYYFDPREDALIMTVRNF